MELSSKVNEKDHKSDKGSGWTEHEIECKNE